MEIGWKEAVLEVLNASDEPMHYTDIAAEVSNKGLKSDLGPRPATAVSTVISVSFKTENDASPFVRIGRGMYWLKDKAKKDKVSEEQEAKEEQQPGGLVKAFGVFWEREKIIWDPPQPRIWGQEAAEATAVDFSLQKGTYVLYDRDRVMYVGMTKDSLGARLRYHVTNSRFSHRWDRFSWFGVFPVGPDAKLEHLMAAPNIPLDKLIQSMEALLIEALEPPLNRRQGDGFKAIEYTQKEDPHLEMKKKEDILKEVQRFMYSKS